MSTGPVNNVAASVVGSTATRSARADAKRTQDARRIAAHDRAGQAAGILAADGKEIRPDDRDADGRRLWATPTAADASLDSARGAHDPPQAGADPTDSRGNRLDLLA